MYRENYWSSIKLTCYTTHIVKQFTYIQQIIKHVHIRGMSTLKFYIRGSVHRNSRLKKSNEMQQYADIYLLPK